MWFSKKYISESYEMSIGVLGQDKLYVGCYIQNYKSHEIYEKKFYFLFFIFEILEDKVGRGCHWKTKLTIHNLANFALEV